MNWLHMLKKPNTETKPTRQMGKKFNKCGTHQLMMWTALEVEKLNYYNID